MSCPSLTSQGSRELQGGQEVATVRWTSRVLLFLLKNAAAALKTRS